MGNPVGNLVHAALELLELLRLEARSHDAQAVADPGADLTVETAVRHGADRLAEGDDDLSLVLLCHKFRCPFRAAQHGQRESVVARAATNLRRIVAIEFGTWRSGRNGGSSGLVTFA